MSVDVVAFQELSQEILGRGAQLRFQARGNSMRPFIEWGDAVIIEPLDGSRLHVGDVIFCRRFDGLVFVHRLIKIETVGCKTVLTTKGDNVPYYDFPISADEVLGRVVQIESHGRRVSLKRKTSRVLGRLVAWFSHIHSPTWTWLTRNLGRLYWFME